MNPDLSKKACTQPTCGIKHVLDEFPIASWVFVTNVDSPFFGWIGQVDSWSQYGCPICYRVSFGVNRTNFDPCDLRKTTDPQAGTQPASGLHRFDGVIVAVPLKLLAPGEDTAHRTRIVKAAVRYDDEVYLGWRHGPVMQYIIASLPAVRRHKIATEDQGFVDEYGVFHSRDVSAKIAARAGQISSIPETLYSEHLWGEAGEPREPDKPWRPS